MSVLLEIDNHPEGIVIPIKAQPGASKNAVRSIQNGQLRVAVTQVAEKGKANKVVAETLAKGLGLKKSAVELISGPLQPQKKFLLRGITAAELLAKLNDLFPDSVPDA